MIRYFILLICVFALIFGAHNQTVKGLNDTLASFIDKTMHVSDIADAG